METYISLLRGINVSGKNKIKMTDLKRSFESHGFLNVQTYIQSGNVIFQYKHGYEKQLEDKIQHLIKSVFGFDVPVVIRTFQDFKDIISATPFSAKEETMQYVTFLKSAPDSFPDDKINPAKNESEIVSIVDKNIYLYCPIGYGRTKLSNAFFEKKLKQTATTRNWKTIRTLCDMAADVSSGRKQQ